MIKGIDISNWQGASVNYDALKSAVQFVVAKASQGTGYVDPTHNRNRDEAHRVGLVFGSYHFANGNDAAAEANHFCDVVQGGMQNGDFLVLDFEIEIGNPVGWSKVFLDTVTARTGVRPLVYTNFNRVQRFDWSPVVAGNYGLWAALWDGNPDAGVPASEWPFAAMKQYTSSGSVPGIGGNVDMDVFYGDAATLRKYGKGGGSAPTVAPVPVPAPAPQPSGGGTYVVQRGDTLSGIAAKFGTTWQTLQSLNGIPNPNLIYAGQTLKVPGGAAPAAPVYNKYTVQKGDYLSSIAARTGQSLQSLIAKNPQISNPNLIYPGQVINI